jgi:hypothetical protein
MGDIGKHVDGSLWIHGDDDTQNDDLIQLKPFQFSYVDRFLDDEVYYF